MQYPGYGAAGSYGFGGLGGGANSNRSSAEAGWGFLLPGERFIGGPYARYGASAAGRDYSLGWRLAPVDGAGGQNLTIGVLATRRINHGAPPEQAGEIEVSWIW